MDKLKSGALKLGLELSEKELRQFQVYYEGLVEWNRRFNLTAVTDYDEVQVRHFLDSLSIVPALSRTADYYVIDIGTGAGLPGIPLKIVLPQARLVLLDATAKKATFLNHIKDKLGLDGVEVVVGRAEEVAHQPEYREKFDLVLSRAVARLAVLAELTLPFAIPGGVAIAQKKGDITPEVNEAGRAISMLGGRLREVKAVGLEGLPEHKLVIIDKIARTPEQYPRRPGIPARRPL